MDTAMWRPAKGDVVKITRGVTEVYYRVSDVTDFDEATGSCVIQLVPVHGQAATPGDEDRIRDAMAEAQQHPGRIVTR